MEAWRAMKTGRQPQRAMVFQDRLAGKVRSLFNDDIFVEPVPAAAPAQHLSLDGIEPLMGSTALKRHRSTHPSRLFDKAIIETE
jgi:hypothetical protein